MNLCNLLAGQLIYTMYEITVSTVNAVYLLSFIALPGMTWARRQGGGYYGHTHTDTQKVREEHHTLVDI